MKRTHIPYISPQCHPHRDLAVLHLLIRGDTFARYQTSPVTSQIQNTTGKNNAHKISWLATSSHCFTNGVANLCDALIDIRRIVYATSTPRAMNTLESFYMLWYEDFTDFQRPLPTQKAFGNRTETQ